ncbi:uncharacterized protein LOC129298221 [Prosopis cineraria]|uniref:uncharacterized protein LOC129298221 n=1 Tax=Prosopis cineraria TaxID=364024 RepID=UPI00241045B2|nr:uncharacterized protein LOC129298221 [Prosopis cineraria]
MWRLFAAVARNLENMKKSSRVADENMIAAEGGNTGDRAEEEGRRTRTRSRRQGLSLIHSILLAPMSVILCVSSNNGDYYNHGASGRGINDGFWGSGDYERFSDMNQMIVSDSMRFAILM